MAEADKTVFLSYRREISWAMARLVLRDLTDHGFDVFMDLEDLDSGEFEQIILAQIATRAHFVVLVEPQSLDRIADDGDWLRREVAHALRHGRNIVPLLIGGVRMPSPADLPADVARLPAFTAVPVYADYFSEAMQKLRERFLRSSDRMSRVSASAAHVDGLRPVSQRRRPGPLDRPSLSQRPRGGSPLVIPVEWTAVAGAARYELQISPTADFVMGWVASPLKATATEWDVVRSNPDDDRFVRVRAVAADSSPGPWSNTVQVR